jgi:hypothetical protein
MVIEPARHCGCTAVPPQSDGTRKKAQVGVTLPQASSGAEPGKNPKKPEETAKMPRNTKNIA